MDSLLNFARMLSDETRQQIMQMVCCEELSVTQIVEALKVLDNAVSQPTVSHHLAELRDAGLVNVRREGRQTFYSLNQEQVTICCGRIMSNFAPEIPLSEIKADS